MNEELISMVSKIKLLMMDVDGVLTDGGLYYANSGERMKKFFVRDGTGIKLLQKAGIEVVFITGLKADLILQRAEDLGVSEVIQDCFQKELAAEDLIARTGLTWEQVAYIGDDLIDLRVMQMVGLAVAVADAVDPIKEVAHLVTALPGGRGAVREVCDLILLVQNQAKS